MAVNRGCSEKTADHFGSNMSGWAKITELMKAFWIQKFSSTVRLILVYV